MNKDKRKIYAEKYRRDGRWRNWQIKHRYGITTEEFDLILNTQSNKCAVCGEDFNDKKKYIDHCHETNIVRQPRCIYDGSRRRF